MYELLFRRIKHKNIFLFIFTFYIVVLSSFLSKNTDCTGILSVTLSMIPLIPILDYIIKTDEKIATRNLKQTYISFILYYLSIFFGAVFGFYISYLLLGQEHFNIQIKAISEIYKDIYGASAISKDLLFAKILINNLKLLILVFLLSFVFGAGAIYIILWNASIIGVFLGLSAEGKSFFTKYILNPLLSFVKLLPHGILEFASYFIAALSGNLIAIALLSEKDKNTIEKIVINSILMFVLSIIVLVIAAFVESFF